MTRTFQNTKYILVIYLFGGSHFLHVIKIFTSIAFSPFTYNIFFKAVQMVFG